MSPPTKAQINKGFHGFQTDDAEFLKPDNPNIARGNWDAAASGHGYQRARFDDDYGWRRGNLGFTDEGGDGAVYNLMPDESRDRSLDHLVGIDDDATGMNSGNKLTGGGGPLTKGRTVGAGSPRYSPKGPGPRTNSRRG
jgi:hypothetical protein